MSNKEMNMDLTSIALIFNQLGNTCSIVHHSCLARSKSSQLTIKRKSLTLVTLSMAKTTKNCSRNSFTTMKTSRKHMYRMSMSLKMSWKSLMLLVTRSTVIADGTPAQVILVKRTLKSSASKSLLVKSSLRRISTVRCQGKNLRKTGNITLRSLKAWISTTRTSDNPALS